MNKAMEIKKEKREYRLEVLVERYCMARAVEWRSASGKSLYGKSGGMEKHQKNWLADRIER